METLQNPKKTKAAKDHHCDYCVGRILKDEIYMKSTHVFDGQIYDWKAHVKCDYLVHKMDMHDSCDEGVSEDDFNETITEGYFEILIRTIPENLRDSLMKVTSQLRKVELRHKIEYLYRHYKVTDSQIEKP